MVTHGRQRPADLFGFETSLVYRPSNRTAKATQRDPISKRKKNRIFETLGLLEWLDFPWN